MSLLHVDSSLHAQASVGIDVGAGVGLAVGAAVGAAVVGAGVGDAVGDGVAAVVSFVPLPLSARSWRRARNASSVGAAVVVLLPASAAFGSTLGACVFSNFYSNCWLIFGKL